MRPQAWQLIVLLVVILLVFGASKLPDITRNVGKSLKIFKNEVKDLRDDGDDVKDAVTTEPQASATTTEAPASTAQTDTPPGVTQPGGATPSDVPPTPGR